MNTKKVNSFEDLIVWEKAIAMSVNIYKLTSKFPKEEMFGLTSQVRRAANSVSLNIAEGSVQSTATFIKHLNIANGSATEVLSGLILSQKLDFIVEEDLQKLRIIIAEVTKMLNSLIFSLERKKAEINVGRN
jgi:four helix bundle protein